LRKRGIIEAKSKIDPRVEFLLLVGNSMRKYLIISITFNLLALLGAPVYFVIQGLGSWGSGPEDDIAIIKIIAVPIIIHGIFISAFGFKRTLIATAVLFTTIAFLCISRSKQISITPGYSEWHAKRSLVSLAWSLPFFASAFVWLPIYHAFERAGKTSSSKLDDEL
jgi:hypothetical protein